MPASYAHYRFGKQVLPALPSDVRQCIQRFRRMFDTGLQGPDIFAYYNPFMKNAVAELANHYHRQIGQEFFPIACAATTSEAARAYLYGVLGHYCLDSTCHPYVQQIVDIGEATHMAFESEFERYLLSLDGVPAPHTFEMSKHLKLTRGECMTAAEFYPEATGANVSHSVKMMAFCNKFCANPNRKRTEKLLNKIKPGLSDCMVPDEEQEDLTLYIHELKAHYDRALERYPAMLEQLTACLNNGEPLGEDFSPNFG